ncbi:MAG TPA: hypothetical protein VLO13_05600 [Halomonas sp.]|nr:hypothetical protein [Halomonas sp.]
MTTKKNVDDAIAYVNKNGRGGSKTYEAAVRREAFLNSVRDRRG